MVEPGNIRETYPINPDGTLGMDVVMLARFAYYKVLNTLDVARKLDGMQPINADGSMELQDRFTIVMQELDIIKRIILNHIPDEIHDSD